MEIQLKDIQGRVVGEVAVSDRLFGAPFNSSLVHQAMVMYQLNRRQGTHKVKGRSEVSGGGAKPWRQKHTGRARAGSNRSPIWRHGGITFGPHPRSYRREMPKRMRRLALRCVLSQKLREDQISVVQSFNEVTGKTKEMAQALRALNVSGSALIATAGPDRTVTRSAHNIPRIWTLPVNLINAHELLKRTHLVLTLDALKRAEDLWGEGADAVEVSPPGSSAHSAPAPAEASIADEETTMVEPAAAADDESADGAETPLERFQKAQALTAESNALLDVAESLRDDAEDLEDEASFLESESDARMEETMAIYEELMPGALSQAAEPVETPAEDTAVDAEDDDAQPDTAESEEKTQGEAQR